MILHFDKDIEVTCRAAAHTGLALTSKANTRAGFNASGDVHRKRAVFFNAASATAAVARVLDDLSKAGTGGASPFNREKALLRADFTHA